MWLRNTHVLILGANYVKGFSVAQDDITNLPCGWQHELRPADYFEGLVIHNIDVLKVFFRQSPVVQRVLEWKREETMDD